VLGPYLAVLLQRVPNFDMPQHRLLLIVDEKVLLKEEIDVAKRKVMHDDAVVVVAAAVDFGDGTAVDLSLSAAAWL